MNCIGIINHKKHEEMKTAWWNHFIEQKKFWPSGITTRRLEKIKPEIWNDADFWNDILFRHSGHECPPEEMERQATETYHHAMGNMAGMILQALVEKRIIKP